VGIKISPAMPFNDIRDDDPAETYTALVRAISPMGLAYLHVLQSAPEPNYFAMLRPLFKGPLAAGGGFTKESGNAMLAKGGADFIVYGKLFTSNPDLPVRFEKNAALTDFDANTFYAGGEQGYITFPSL
jgi:N-ethylmaleimide reductase